jgi:hypothetical protein
MAREYIEQRDGGYYLVGSRVSLGSVVYEFLRGESPEAMAQPLPPYPWSRSMGDRVLLIAARGNRRLSLRGRR